MKVATAELSPDHQLPSVRALAQQLTINPNTVARAYTELMTSDRNPPMNLSGAKPDAPGAELRAYLQKNLRLAGPEFAAFGKSRSAGGG